MTDKRIVGWIKALQVGDKVFVNGGGGFQPRRRVKTVERITPTGRIVVDGITFDPYGHQTGSHDPYTRHLLIEWSQEVEDEVRKVNRQQAELGRVRAIDWRKMDPILITQVLSLIEKAEEDARTI